MTASNDWTPSLRYPDPAIRSLDPRFDKYRVMLTNIERLATGTLWGEGPVYFGDQRCVLWSDIPNNRILRWDEETGAVSRLPQAIQPRQRQYARPARTPHHLRAWPPHHPHRI